jgi:hypothetical protein
MTLPVKVDRPTFIVGPHRSGTTLLYGTLGRHPDLGYYNRQNRHTPDWPRLAALITRLGGRDDPMEAQNIWDRFRSHEDDSMTEADVTPEVKRWFRWNIATVLAARNATRFIAKYPRLSLRLPWIDAIFPDSFVIHMHRDWRAVVQSTALRIEKRKKRGGGWFGVRIPGSEALEGLPSEIVAGRIFRFVSLELEKQRERFGDRYLIVGYEELCASPVETVRSILERCDWRWVEEFEDSIPRNLRVGEKWRTQLDPAMIEEIRAEDPGSSHVTKAWGVDLESPEQPSLLADASR